MCLCFLRSSFAYLSILFLCTLSKNITVDILHAVKQIHSHNLIHCDLKPSNVFLTHNLHAVVGDFDGLRTEATGVTTALGVTARYVSPNVLLGKEPLSCFADIYSLGIMFQELFVRGKDV